MGSTSTAQSRTARRSRGSRSSPLPSGRPRSTTATSGRSVTATSCARRIVVASTTRATHGSPVSSAVMPRRTIGWSSTTSTVALSAPTAPQRRGTTSRTRWDSDPRPGTPPGRTWPHQGVRAHEEGPDMTDTRAPVAPEPESTTDLLRRTAGGDQAGWAELVRRYTPLLHSRMRPYRLQQADQLDVIQTVWLRLATHIHRIHTPEHLGGWLATVIARECQGLARGAGRVALPGEVIELTAPTAEPGPETRAVDDDVARRLWGAVAEL